MTEEVNPNVTPVKGYVAQTEVKLGMVNSNKVLEERMLQVLDMYKENAEIDQRWLAIGRTHIEQAFMAINRAIFKPERVKL